MEYNCRVYDYPAGQHVTIYKRTITRSEDTGNEDTEDLEVEADMNVNFTKTYKNEDRTKEEEEHCKKVSLSGTKIGYTTYHAPTSGTGSSPLLLTAKGQMQVTMTLSSVG